MADYNNENEYDTTNCDGVEIGYSENGLINSNTDYNDTTNCDGVEIGYDLTIDIDNSSCEIGTIGSTTYSYEPKNCMIYSGNGLSVLEGKNNVLLQSTDRKFNPKEIMDIEGKKLDNIGVSGCMYITNDNGIWIETSEPLKFINLVEELEELIEMKKMIKELYYAPASSDGFPGGPGYQKAQRSYESHKDN